MRTILCLTALLLAVGCKKDAPPPEPAAAPAAAVKPAPTPRAIELKVTDDGFQPGTVTVKQGEPVKLVVTRVTDATCATEILIADTDIKADLPLNKPVEVAWTPTKAGQVKFGCAMDMMVGGVLVVE